MSAREPFWYCHECHAEMRPLMVPDPHCASCNGTFVERIENPTDDPREFQMADAANWEDVPLPGDMSALFAGLQSILRGPNPSPPVPARSTSPRARSTSPENRRMSGDRPSSPRSFTTGRNNSFTVRLERSGPSGTHRTVILGTPGGNNDIPRLSQFAPPRFGEGTQQDRPNITGPMLAQYLLALMGPGRGADPFSELLGGMFPGGMPGGSGSPENGRWGDYVFNQEALDQIISQIMENSNSHQPVPASEEAMKKLPREVLTEGSPLLEKDCAVCKEQFKLDTEDLDELTVITLPCSHPFHEPCILPWLKNSGTCPVCRYQLVPQPSSHSPGPSGPSRSERSSPNTGTSGGGGGIMQSVFTSLFSGGSPNNAPQNQSSSGSSSSNTQTSAATTTSGARPSTPRRQSSDYDIPGGWGDQVD